MKKNKIRRLVMCIFILTLSCTSQKNAIQDDDFATDAAATDVLSADNDNLESDLNLDDTTKSETAKKDATNSVDEFAEFDETPPNKVTDNTANVAKNTSEDDLEKELSQLDDSPTAVTATQTPAENSPAATPEVSTKVEQPVPPPKVSVPSPEVAAEPIQPPQPPTEPEKEVSTATKVTNTAANTPVAEVTPVTETAPSRINSIQYQSNQNGGTVIINSTKPLQFTTRINTINNQLIIEVQNVKVPRKLKRSLNTKDMASSIGGVDIYQRPNSEIARFVIQLRPGATEPLVQPEGNALLIVGAANETYVKNNKGGNAPKRNEDHSFSVIADQAEDVNPDLTSEGIMSSQSLEDFLASNNKFYGKKISIEANKLDINDAFKFLAEESNVNMIIDEGIKGDVSLKLRQVPWDQAFVLLLKSKKLGYRRQGSVIRIASMETLLKEEDEAIKLRETRRSDEPLAVKRFFIGYADMADLEKKIKEFISSTTLGANGQLIAMPSRGKVISDLRTSSLIVTETPRNMAKIEKLIIALDSQPKQVLIEGKVVEASEKFVRGMGVDWSSPQQGGFDSAPSANLIRPTLKFASKLGSEIFNPSFGLGAAGRPGDLGNLTASLSLGEKEDKLRVLSSPRISVLSNHSATIAQTVNVSVDKVSATNPAAGGTTTVTSETVAVGVSLKVTPQVSNEGTVVMDLDIERSFPGSAKASEIEKRNAKTKVIVRSGQTAVIGGIFQADATESTSGIPYLKDIPIFGLLFKGSQKSKNKNELVIFVTPRIQKAVRGEEPTTSSLE